MLEQNIARFRDATVIFVAATGVRMRRLGQPPKGGIDLRRLQRTFHRQVQGLAVFLIIVVEIQPKQEGPAFFSRLEAQINLILLPSLARHDETFAKSNPSPHFKFVKTERPHDAIGRRQKGVPAVLAILDMADRRHIEIPIEPFQMTHSSLSVMPRAFVHEPAMKVMPANAPP